MLTPVTLRGGALDGVSARYGFGMMTGDFDSLSNATWKANEKEIDNAKTRLYRLHTEPWRRWANGFSCLCFVLVGAPMAIRLRHAEFLAIFFVCFLPTGGAEDGEPHFLHGMQATVEVA